MIHRSQEFTNTVQNTPTKATVGETTNLVRMAKQCKLEKLEYSETLITDLSPEYSTAHPLHHRYSSCIFFLLSVL